MRRRARWTIAASLALVALAPAAPAAGAGVLVVGDSLAVGTAPYLKHELKGIPIRFDVKVGRPSPEGVRLLQRELRPDDDVVVFDLGTNDAPSVPAVLSADLARVKRIVGSRCIVVATVNRPPVGRITTSGLNAALRAFAAASDNVLLVPWHDEAQAPGVLGPDHTHATAAGYAARGKVFAEAVNACLSTSAPTTIPTVPVTAPPRNLESTTIKPAHHAAPPPPRRHGPSATERARIYGTMAALVGRLVDVVSGNLNA
ncbi:MAG TPA: hypothetical protein VGI54_12425 [Solirubrobacteraceae bacterium]